MKITAKTLPIVLGMIKKISKTHPILNTQLSYPAYKRNNINRVKAGINVLNVEQSMIHSFPVKDAQIHDSITSYNTPYININNQGKTIDYNGDYVFADDDPQYWRATVINIGTEVTFKNNILIIKEKHPTNNQMIAINKIWFTKE